MGRAWILSEVNEAKTFLDLNFCWKMTRTVNRRPAGAPGFPRPAGGGGLNIPPSISAPELRSDT